MSASDVLAELKRRAPSVAFEVTAERDIHYVWDGDGPDPEDGDFFAHVVDFTATTVIEGELYESQVSLGGHYMKKDNDPGEVGGYLVQKLMDAINELLIYAFKGIETSRGQAIGHQLIDAMAYLLETLKANYEAQIAKTGYPN
jgi:hypothetical protein